MRVRLPPAPLKKKNKMKSIFKGCYYIAWLPLILIADWIKRTRRIK